VCLLLFLERSFLFFVVFLPYHFRFTFPYILISSIPDQLTSHVALRTSVPFVNTYKSTSDFALQEASPETSGGAGPEAEGGAGEDKGDYGDFYEYDYSAKQDAASPSSATNNDTTTPRDVNVKCVFWLSFSTFFLKIFKGTAQQKYVGGGVAKSGITSFTCAVFSLDTTSHIFRLI
jgi:hypothetical protein